MRTTRLTATYRPVLVLIFLVSLAFPKSSAVADDGAPNTRPPTDKQDLRYWLENMIVYHHFSAEEVQAATGLPRDQIQDAAREFRLQASRPAPKKTGDSYWCCLTRGAVIRALDSWKARFSLSAKPSSVLFFRGNKPATLSSTRPKRFGGKPQTAPNCST